MNIKLDKTHSLTRRLSIATLALAALTPLAAAIAQVSDDPAPPADTTAPAPKQETAPTPDPKVKEATPTAADIAKAEQAKAAEEAKAEKAAAKKKCEEEKPRNPCAPRKKKKCE